MDAAAPADFGARAGVSIRPFRPLPDRRQILGGRAPTEVANRAGHSVEMLLRSLRRDIRKSITPGQALLSEVRSGGRGIRTHGDVAATMVFKSICDSVSTSAVTWVFSGYVHRAAHDHPVYIPCGLCGVVRVIFWPEPDASAGGVEDQLSVDADPRFADPVHRPLADEPQRPGRGQRPHPPPKELRVRGAATTARLQDRPCGFKVTAWPSADRLAGIGELHADREVLELSAPAPQHLWRKVFIEAGGSRADAADYEEFESPGVGRYPDDRYRGLLGPVKVQGIDRHDARKFRLRRVPRVMHPARRRFGGW